MLRRLLHRSVAKLERDFDYDATYLHEVIDISPAAFFKFGAFQIMSAHRGKAHRDAWFAARMSATLSEDCGPCTQIVVDMALKDGMDAGKISALLRGDLERAGADAELGFRFGTAVAQNTVDAGPLSEEVARRYGKNAQVALAYAVATARVYPTVKRGMGHGMACTRIRISDETIVLGKVA